MGELHQRQKCQHPYRVSEDNKRSTEESRFILHHQVMQDQVDNQLTVEMVNATKKRFPNLAASSFDKGFHTKENQIALKDLLELPVLPRKGKLTEEARTIEQSPEFVKARRAHSAVESAINALEVHGLDFCPDEGIEGFKRYVALAVVARNIHRIGAILWEQDQKARNAEMQRVGKREAKRDKDNEEIKPEKIAA